MITKTPFRKAPRTSSRGNPHTTKYRIETPRRSSCKRRRIVTTPGDRFIPNRARLNVDVCNSSLRTSKKQRKASAYEAENYATDLQSDYRRRMKAAVLDIPLEELPENGEDSRLLPFGESQTTISKCTMDPYAQDSLRVFQQLQGGRSNLFSKAKPIKKQPPRKVQTQPVRVLDAPDLVNDFYHDPISWSTNDVVAVALEETCYLWERHTGDAYELMSTKSERNPIACVSFAPSGYDGRYLAVSSQRGRLQLFDTVVGDPVRCLNGHTDRVGSIAWNDHIMTTGGRDSIIIQHDIRCKRHIVATYRGHKEEVCGMQWNPGGGSLASGGNDNRVCIWDIKMSRRPNNYRYPSEHGPRLELTQHKAAVKALAWCPFRTDYLTTGGGTADGTIKFWNVHSGALMKSVDVGSQVSGLLWSPYREELLSSHGFGNNQLVLWCSPTMTKLKELKHSDSRVVHMIQQPDGSEVATADSDQRLYFWDIFGAPPRSQKDTFDLEGLPFAQTIR